MSYHDETTGAIAKAIVELKVLSHISTSIAETERLEIISTNAAAELDKLQSQLNYLRSKVAERDLLIGGGNRHD